MANRAFARATRRKTEWAGFGSAGGGAVLPGLVSMTAGTAVVLSTNFVIEGSALSTFEQQETITRMIGSFAASLDLGTANLDATVAVGCAVARREAITAGVASLPSPEDDPNFEWLYYGVFMVKNTNDTTQGAPGFVREHFDVRGQRRMHRGKQIVWLAEANNNVALAGVGGRYLIKVE